MKKTLIPLFLLSIAFQANSQNANTGVSIVKTGNSKKTGLIVKTSVRTRVASLKGEDATRQTNTPVSNNLSGDGLKKTKSPSPLSLTTATQIGTTYYQLQTNSSVRNGLFKNKDGSVSAAWVFSNDPSGIFADRGTGYAYNNGSAWTVLNPTARIEGALAYERTGWPSVAITKGNQEAIIAHNTGVNNLDFMNRPAKGTGSWTQDTITLKSPAQDGNWWPRMVPGNTDSNTLHVISVTAPAAGGFGGKEYLNQSPALTYCRSQDGGATWDIKHTVNPLINNAAGFSGFGGDSYAIDARGTTVAYVAGNQTSDLVLIKSTDNGTTWTKTTILSFPVKNFTGQALLKEGSGVADTVNTSDGSYAILLDKNNKAHVWYGNMFVSNPTTNDSGAYDYYPGTAGLMYWTEGMATDSVKIIESWMDYAGSGSLNLPSANFGTYNVSLTSHPSAGMDSSGNIFLAYDGIIQGTNDGTNKALRNIYVTGSKDGGKSWMLAYRPDSDDGFEQVYPSVARYVNSCMSLTYQEDYAAGHGIGTGNPDASSNAGVQATIYYNCIPVSSVILGVKENTTPVLSVNNYPNPFSGVTNVDVNLQKPAVIRVDVYNTVGQSVLPTKTLSLNSGLQTFTLDGSNLKAGLYFYCIRTTEGSVTRKMIVQ